MIAPELDHPLLQLAFGKRRAIERRFHELLADLVLVLAVELLAVVRKPRVVLADKGGGGRVVDLVRREVVIEISAESQLARERGRAMAAKALSLAGCLPGRSSA